MIKNHNVVVTKAVVVAKAVIANALAFVQVF
jgi:hypothetical protein